MAEGDQSCFICSDLGADSSFVPLWDHKAELHSGSLKFYSMIYTFVSFDNEYKYDSHLHIKQKPPLHSHWSPPH